MNNAEIREALSRLQEMEFLLEEEYANNGGEVTDYTEQQEMCIEALREMLTTDGVDSLGRWLKAKEDQIVSLKAEKDNITRKIKKCEGTIEFIKGWEEWEKIPEVAALLKEFRDKEELLNATLRQQMDEVDRRKKEDEIRFKEYLAQKRAEKKSA